VSHKTGLQKKRAFTLIEIMISLLLVSSLGLLLTNYFRKSSQNMASSERTGILEDDSLLTSKFLTEEIMQSVFLNPSCTDNPMDATVTLDCDDVVARAGVTPLPGVSKEDVDSMVDFETPANIDDPSNSLTDDNDAIRLVQFDTDAECPLDRSIPNNPSNTLERLWVNPTACANELVEGRLYVLMETVGGVVYSNLFQITDIQPSTAAPNQVDISSVSSPFNHVGGLGIAGYSNVARIYSVKLVEFAVSSVDEGLWRREIRPDDSDLSGYQDWTLLQAKVENLQFFPMTLTAAGPIVHDRTMAFTTNVLNDGLEDIRGVSPRVVLKSDRQDPTGTTYDNPITAGVTETDAFPRKELNFHISIVNAR
jgi:prepilin-type N-terminal cleavage/methylation domain-containing protein